MSQKILVVEDDVATLKVLSRYLTTKGYTIEQATDGLKALDKLERDSFDLVLSDITMPAMSGLALAARIRVRSPATPVILMTGDPSMARGAAGAQAGARHLLSKPLKLDELIQKIREVLRSH